MSTDIGVWIAALCTIACFTFLWKENAMFRSFQHIYVGISAGYYVVYNYNFIKTAALDPLLVKGDMTLIFPIVLGIMLFGRFVKGFTWIGRWPVAFLMGLGAALSIKILETEFLGQAIGSMVPLTSFNNIVLVLGTAFGLCYFYFTIKPSAGLKTASMFGRYVLMLSFGAGFGNAVMGRVSLLISRMQFLFSDWIHLIKV